VAVVVVVVVAMEDETFGYCTRGERQLFGGAMAWDHWLEFVLLRRYWKGVAARGNDENPLGCARTEP
jgi:hypothetical protein